MNMVTRSQARASESANAVASMQERDFRSASGVEDVKDAQLLLGLASERYRQLLEEHRPEEERLERLIARLSAIVEGPVARPEHVNTAVGENIVELKQQKQGEEQQDEEQGKEQPKVEEQQVIQSPEKLRVEITEDMRKKLRSLGEFDMNDKLLNTHAETWAGICPICRIRRGERREHSWWSCPEGSDDVAAMQKVHDGMSRALRSSQVGKGSVPIKGSCPDCQLPRNMCWMAVVQNVPTGTIFKQQCRFRGVVSTSEAAMLAIEPIVQRWEEIEGGVMDNGIRYGYYAIYKLWKSFAWLGVVNIKSMSMKKFQVKCSQRIQDWWNGTGGSETDEATGRGDMV